MIAGEVDRKALAEIVARPGTFATVLHAIAIHLFGHECYDWETETLGLELKDELGVDVPAINLDKLQSLLTAVSLPRFYNDWAVFTATCEILNGDSTPLEAHDPPTPEELAWGVVEVKLNDETPERFGEEVARYVGVILDREGFMVPPDALSFAILPQRYRGSDFPADLAQQRNLNADHLKRVQEFLQAQSFLMFRQIRSLPWMSEAELHRLSDALKLS